MDWVEVVLPTAGGVVMLALIAAAGLVAWFGDRSRGRRRCPKCWYAMSGVPGLRCPECGHAVKRDREFFRNRVRWRVVTVLVVLAVVAYAGGVGARVRARSSWGGPSMWGVWAAVPTWAFMIAARGTEAQEHLARRADARSMRLAWQVELDYRVAYSAVSKWEAWISLPRFETPEGGLDQFLKVPKRWRQGNPISPRFHERWANDQGVWVALVERARPEVTTTTEVMIEYDVMREWCGHLFSAGVARQPCVMVPPREPLLERVRSEAWDERVRTLLDVRLIRDVLEPALVVNDRVESWSDVRIAMVFEVEVASEGRVIGRGQGSVNWTGPTYTAVREIEMKWDGVTTEEVAALAEQGKAEIVVRGVEPPHTWRSTYLGSPDAVECAYWGGEFRVPLRVDPSGVLWQKSIWRRPKDEPGAGGR